LISKSAFTLQGFEERARRLMLHQAREILAGRGTAKPAPCPKCNLAFTSYRARKRHLLSHLEDET